jgi:hypothetical protein
MNMNVRNIYRAAPIVAREIMMCMLILGGVQEVR